MHRDQIQADLERNGMDARRARRDRSGGQNSEAETLLRHQVQVLSERILELEAQQGEPELFSGSSPPPPGYTTLSGNVTTDSEVLNNG